MSRASILIATYNRMDFCPRTLDSARSKVE